MNQVNGLQKERTALSWLRTQLVLFGIGIVLFRFALAHPNLIICVTSIFAMLLACACTLWRTDLAKLFVSTIIFLLALAYVWTMLGKVIS
ncbi:DUF202 domain-containing protein [Vibrio astriarenae]|uniref:DUF202 domain-containing protein n=1 Tax=Vibrio astriarenae TaxID=1481923 RepID=A0A7Z2YFJ2_9VIBR|nr:DUF202 domain-containing protein [Vibrio astriarenae]